MKLRSLRPRAIAAAVAALVAASGFSADSSFARSPVYVDDSGKLNPGSVSHFVDATTGTARYIVRFKEQPVAVHFASASADRSTSTGVFRTGKNGRTRLDVTNSTVQAYAAQLSSLQQQRLADIRTAIGYEPVKPKRYQMVHALNAVVLSLKASDVQKVLKVDGVAAVTRDRPHALSTDIGPGFVGASSVWFGTRAGQDSVFAGGFDDKGGYRGDGIVIGDIDTGYNSMSPSFQATDASGYTVRNPLGTGNFLGQCGVADISLAGCNDKVIGVYDEIDLTNSDPNFTGDYSVEDTQGHGSHTASTAGGDGRSATLSGYTAPVSGIAPHANLVIYYACSPDVTIQCSDAATSGSVDQAIQDGIVDALNFSISGGTDPWNDPTSLAFLAAADAGIFVAAAAGNTGTSVPVPLPGTANHAEPWVTTVAAGTHTGGSIAPTLTVTGPGTPPASIQGIPLTAGSGGVSATATFTGPIVLSPTFYNTDTSAAGHDGCTANGGFPAGVFAGAAALVSRGTCSFSEKVNNATTAGAVAVVISDNRVEAPLTPSVPGTTIPAYTVTQQQGTDLKSFLAANSSTGAAVIPYPPSRLPQQPDELANFSLLGPVAIDVIKPDVQAPGVNILASIANDGTVDGPNLVALYNGTSMATPHTSGSGALLMGLHTDWTAQETRSALMMTALEQGLTKPDGTTPSDYFDRGSGRLQDFPASNSGLVLNETGLNYFNADPANGGNPGTLNIASMQAASCLTTDHSGTTATCSFTRKFRSTQDAAVTYTSAVTGVSAIVTPASLTVPAHANAQPLTVAVDATSYNGDNVFHFGELTLTPSDTTLPTLHLPIAVRVPPPVITATPSPLAITLTGGAGSGTLTVANTGGAPLSVTSTNDTTSAATKYVVIDQASQGNFGFYSDLFTDFGGGFYAADDFQAVGASTNLSKLSFPGFTTGATALSGFAGANVHFEIYTDAAGVPNGNPETVAPSYVYSYVAVIGTTPGLDVTGNTIRLDLTAAGAPATALPAGRYWMVVWPELAYGDGPWVWFESVNTLFSNAHNIDPGDLSGGGITNWVDNTSSGDFPGMAMHIESKVACGAPWLSATPSTLSINAGDSAPLTVHASAAGTAFLCLDSNDPVNPVLAVAVTAGP